MELLDREDREVIWLRHWLELPFEEVGEQLGLAADAARMRYQRALPRLAECLAKLRSGRIDPLLAE
jgi:DNA-directed RNA polymerase specialized sigma24 family protein